MIDAHVHLDNGPLTLEYLLEFVETAKKQSIDEIHIVNHTHRFKEFAPLYEDCKCNIEQIVWFTKRDLKDSIEDYFKLIQEVRGINLPVKVLFGLEVCYFKDREDLLRDLLSKYKFDFLIGSVHFIHNIAYDCGWSIKELWDKYDIDDLYRTYYDSVKSLIKSKLFTHVGHMDTFKMFNRYPTFDLKDTYKEIAKLLNENNVIAENNTKVHYGYGHKEIGLNNEFLDILKENNCKIISSSDAHEPESVGRLFDKIYINVY